MSEEQKKQRFSVGDVEVMIEVKSWKVQSNGGKWSTIMEAYVFHKKGFGVRGQSVCVPPDEFNFRTGAGIALRNALATEGMFDCTNLKIVKQETRKAIWDKFNKVLPK